jgi:hypothetical protein
MREHSLRVSENRMLRQVFGPKWDDVAGGEGDCITESFITCSLIKYYSNVSIKRIKLARNVARIGEGRISYRVSVGKPDGKRPRGRPRLIWEDNIQK